MKSPFRLLNRAASALVALTLLFIFSCKDPTGPSEKPSAPTKVSLKVTGLATTVRQSFVGDFSSSDAWDNTGHTFELTDGNGQSEEVVIQGTGAVKSLAFTIADAGVWTKNWYEAGGQFGTNDDSWDHLSDFTVQVPLDGKSHRIEVEYPSGWNLPRVKVDGAAPSNLVVDEQGHLLATKRPFGSNGTITQTEEFAYDGDKMETWTRHFGYRTNRSLTQTVWTFDNSKLVKTVDTGPGYTITRTFDNARPDLNLSTTLGNNARIPLTLLETQSDREVEATIGTENGESTWTSLTITPDSTGTPSVVSVPVGTLALFELHSEGWINQTSLEPESPNGTDTGVSLVGPVTDRELEGSYGAPTPNGNPEAHFMSITPRLRDWSGYHAVQALVSNPGDEGLVVGMFIQTQGGSDWVWHQAREYAVGPGSTKTLNFDLDDVKSNATGDAFNGSRLTHDDQVVRYGFFVREFSKGGKIKLDDVKLLVTNPDSVALSSGSVPDAALRARLEAATGKTFGSTLTLSVAKSLGWFSAEDQRSITDLTGLEQFSGIRELWLNQNTVNLSYLTPQRFPLLRQIGVQQYDWDNESPRFSLATLRAVLKTFPRWDQVHIGSVKSMDNAEWTALYDEVYYPNRSTLTRLELDTDDSSTLDALTGIGNLTNLEVLQINGNRHWSALASLAPLTKLWHLGISKTSVTNLQTLKTLYDAGGFRHDNQENDNWVNTVELEELGLDLTSGTANRVIVDYLENHGVHFEKRENVLSRFSVPTGTIIADGTFTDWDGKTPALTDPSGDSDAAYSALDVTAITLASGSSNIGIRTQSAGSNAPAVTEQYGGTLHFRPLSGTTGVDIEVVHYRDEDSIVWKLSTRTWDPITRQEGESTEQANGTVGGTFADWEIAVPKSWLTSGTVYRLWFDTAASSGDDWINLDDSHDDPVFAVFP